MEITYKPPGIKAHLLAFAVLIIPKIGAAADLAIKIPTPEMQEWYLRSVNHTVDVFRDLLQQLAAGSGSSLTLANIDLDTGDRVTLGSYPLADQTYERLLARITAKPERRLPAKLKENVLDYYGAPVSADPKPEIAARLSELKSMEVARNRNARYPVAAISTMLASCWTDVS
jgi:hypothetical protein